MSESEVVIHSKENVLKELSPCLWNNSTETQEDNSSKHIELLIEINKNLNLTRMHFPIDDALVLRILDSLLPLPSM